MYVCTHMVSTVLVLPVVISSEDVMSTAVPGDTEERVLTSHVILGAEEA